MKSSTFDLGLYSSKYFRRKNLLTYTSIDVKFNHLHWPVSGQFCPFSNHTAKLPCLTPSPGFLVGVQSLVLSIFCKTGVICTNIAKRHSNLVNGSLLYVGELCTELEKHRNPVYKLKEFSHKVSAVISGTLRSEDSTAAKTSLKK